jgi:acetyl-CoA carboxylase carboxyltransferase component
MAFEKQMEEWARRRQQALEMGGPDKVARQHAKGRSTARERIDKLLDPHSFVEMGMLNHSDMPEMEDRTPADSKVAGFGKIDERRVIVVADDFTVLAATSSRVAGRKEGELKAKAARQGFPLIVLGDAGGSPNAGYHGVPRPCILRGRGKGYLYPDDEPGQAISDDYRRYGRVLWHAHLDGLPV